MPCFILLSSTPCSVLYRIRAPKLLPIQQHFPKLDQMLSYSELGRHTPPPPPYSESKSGTPKATLGNGPAQVPAPPPPPPPYLSSTPKHDCNIPSMDELRRAVVSDDPYLGHDGNAISLPPVPTQLSTAQGFDAHIGFKDYSRNWGYDRNRLGVPAHPVEPKWNPVGVLGYPGPSSGGARTPLPKLSLEGASHLMPHGCCASADSRTRPGKERRFSQSIGTGYLDSSFSSCATHAPMHTQTTVPAMGQKQLHTPRKRSNQVVASFGDANVNHTTAPLESSGIMCPFSILPSQQALEERAMVTQVPTPQGFDAVERLSDLGSPIYLNDASSNNEDSSDENGESNREAMVREGRCHASPARFNHGPRFPKDYTMAQGQDRGYHVQNFSTRRPSASARFAPYQRRRPNAAGTIDQRLVKEDGGEME